MRVTKGVFRRTRARRWIKASKTGQTVTVNFPGEIDAVVMPYRNSADGSQDAMANVLLFSDQLKLRRVGICGLFHEHACLDSFVKLFRPNRNQAGRGAW